jgi:SAM-dependent methyltransferase
MAATHEARRAGADKVSAHWGATLPEVELTFYGFPPLRPYLYRSVAGAEPEGPLGRDWFERWAVEHVLGDRAPVGDCLSLCCGFGEIERILARLGAFESCRAVDFAEPAIKAAREAAATEGLTQISYEVVDVESISLKPESVDLVWANGALHHLERLDHVVGEAHRALRPGGLFVANEYIGPNHQQLGPRESELVNATIHLIPPELRGQSEATFVPAAFKGPRWLELAYRGVTGRLPDKPDAPLWQQRAVTLRRAVSPSRLLRRHRQRFGRVWDNNPWYFRNVDPSEGVRASEIVGALRRVFDEVEVRPYNGSLLAYALDRRFYESFDPADEGHRALLDTLTDLEQRLIASGELAPHHAALVARKRD